jgi:hypothetical protein
MGSASKLAATACCLGRVEALYGATVALGLPSAFDPGSLMTSAFERAARANPRCLPSQQRSRWLAEHGSAPELGALFGRYCPIEELGRGGDVPEVMVDAALALAYVTGAREARHRRIRMSKHLAYAVALKVSAPHLLRI